MPGRPSPSEPLIVATILPPILASWMRLLATKRVWRRRGDVPTGMRLLFGQGGLLRNVLRRMPEFGRADFHPAKHDTSALEAAWRDRPFGADGTLNDQLRHRTPRNTPAGR